MRSGIVNQVEGTARQLEEMNLKLNGKELNQVAINMLADCGLIQVVGEGPKPARGKTPKLYRAVSRGEFQFSVPVLISKE